MLFIDLGYGYVCTEFHSNLNCGFVDIEIVRELFDHPLYTSTKFQFNMCNLCEENELVVDYKTDRQTAAKQYALPFYEGVGEHNHMCTSN